MVSTAPSAGPYVNYNFRMIDASRAGSEQSLMDVEARRRASATSSNFGADLEKKMERAAASPPPEGARHISRVSSVSSSSSGLRSGSPHTMLIESSFCGPKPILTPSLDMVGETISLSSEVNNREFSPSIIQIFTLKFRK